MLRFKQIVITLAFSVVCVLSGKDVLAVEVAIIANPSVELDTLDKDLLYDVYRGDKRTWDDGSDIKVWDLGERGEVRKSFYKFIGKRPSRMKSIWMRQLLTGEGEPPEVAETQDDMLQKIVSTPGAIGYVDKELVDDRVKLLLVIEEKK